MDFWYPQSVFLEKNDGSLELVTFALKFRCFTDQNQESKWTNMKMNFDYFQIQKSQTVRAEKFDKNGVICLVSMFLS